MIIYTQGTFDLFHNGHVRFLRRCKKLAGKDGKVYVSLLNDKVVEKYRGKPPILTFEERKEILEGCKFVDGVIKGDNRRTRQEIYETNPDIVVIGSDWAKKDLYSQYKMTSDHLDDFLVYLPYTDSISSTKIKERLNHG